MSSGGLDITFDKTLSPSEALTNSKINQVRNFVGRIKSQAVTGRELNVTVANFNLDTLDDLKAVSVAGLADGVQALVKGYSTLGDRGGQSWYWDADAVRASNPEVRGRVVHPDNGTLGVWRVVHLNGDLRAYGAKGDGVTDDAAAFQAALDAAAATRTHLSLPENRTYLIKSKITFPASLRGIRIKGNRSVIKWGGTDDAANVMIDMGLNNQVQNNIFEQVDFNGDNKVGWIIKAVCPSGSTTRSNPANGFWHCEFRGAKTAIVQIGDYSTTGRDMDTPLWRFEQCRFYVTGSETAFIGDALNHFQSVFDECIFADLAQSIGTSPLSSGYFCQHINGSQWTYNDCIFDSMGPDGWCILHKNGSLKLEGVYSEHVPFLKTEGMPRSERTISIRDCMMNTPAAVDRQYTIYAPVGHIILENTTWGKPDVVATGGVRIYAGEVCHAKNCWLGSRGDYEFDLPELCSVEGYSYNTAPRVAPNIRQAAAVETVAKRISAPTGVIPMYGVASACSFDITNPTGTTFRYTYTSGGTNPQITSAVALYKRVVISVAAFSAGNRGTFTVTAAGANWFEVDNASGVAESSKALTTGDSMLFYSDVPEGFLVGNPRATTAVQQIKGVKNGEKRWRVNVGVGIARALSNYQYTMDGLSVDVPILGADPFFAVRVKGKCYNMSGFTQLSLNYNVFKADQSHTPHDTSYYVQNSGAENRNEIGTLITPSADGSFDTVIGFGHGSQWTHKKSSGAITCTVSGSTLTASSSFFDNASTSADGYVEADYWIVTSGGQRFVISAYSSATAVTIEGTGTISTGETFTIYRANRAVFGKISLGTNTANAVCTIDLEAFDVFTLHGRWYTIGEYPLWPLVRFLSGAPNYKPIHGNVVAPSASTSWGVPGMKSYDASYIYQCVDRHDWRRTAIATW